MKFMGYLKRGLEANTRNERKSTTRILLKATQRLFVAWPLAVAVMMMLPSPARAQFTGEPLMLQNLTSQGWVSRYYDYANQMYTFPVTFSYEEKWVFSPQGVNRFNIKSLSGEVMMPLPFNYYQWAPVVTRNVWPGCPIPYCVSPQLNSDYHVWQLLSIPGFGSYHFQLQNVGSKLCIAAGWNGGQQVSEMKQLICDASDPRQWFGILGTTTWTWK
jgi:hypothetical protein